MGSVAPSVERLVGLAGAVVRRPPELDGQVELVRAAPAWRVYPARVGVGLTLWVEDEPGSAIRYEGRAVDVPGGAVGVGAPGAVWSCAGTTVGFRSIEVAPAWLGDLPPPVTGRSPVFHADALRLARFAGTFDALWDGGSALACDEALLRLVEAVSAPAARQGGGASGAVRRARELLDARLDRRVSLADVAGASGIGRFTLLRAFRRAVGLTPYAYHLQVRLAEARRRLRAGEPPGAVAAGTGFADQSHLTRHFVRTFGVSPARYARGLP